MMITMNFCSEFPCRSSLPSWSFLQLKLWVWRAEVINHCSSSLCLWGKHKTSREHPEDAARGRQPPPGPRFRTDGWRDRVDKRERQRGGGGGEAATRSAGRLRAPARNSSKRWKRLQGLSSSSRTCMCACMWGKLPSTTAAPERHTAVSDDRAAPLLLLLQVTSPSRPHAACTSQLLSAPLRNIFLHQLRGASWNPTERWRLHPEVSLEAAPMW